jgi:hypothetical protein
MQILRDFGNEQELKVKVLSDAKQQKILLECLDLWFASQQRPSFSGRVDDGSSRDANDNLSSLEQSLLGAKEGSDSQFDDARESDDTFDSEMKAERGKFAKRCKAVIDKAKSRKIPHCSL